MKKLLDTNVLIAYLEHHDSAARALLTSTSRPAISLLSRFEMLIGIRPEEASLITAFLNTMETYPLSEDIIDRASEMLRVLKQKGRPVRTYMNDALLAATAELYGCELVTANVRDFRLFPTIKIQKFIPKLSQETS